MRWKAPRARATATHVVAVVAMLLVTASWHACASGPQTDELDLALFTVDMLRVRVVLLLPEGAMMNTEQLYEVLVTYRHHVVGFVDAARPSVYSYGVVWEVVTDGADAHVDALERALATALAAAPAGPAGVARVDPSVVERVLVERKLVDGLSAAEVDSGNAAVFIIAPGARASPRLRAYGYASEPDADAVLAPAFVGAGRFVVVDVTAAPCQAGAMDGTTSACLAGSFPRLAAGDTRLAVADVAAAAFSALRFVFLPDVPFAGVDDAAHVLVPLVVLRDHSDGSVLAHVNVSAIQAQVAATLAPGQRVTLFPVEHPLYAHRHIAMSVAKAMRTTSELHPLREGSGGGALLARYARRERETLDAAVLQAELEDAPDLLAGGLFASLAPFRPSANQADILGALGGVRVLPVYVLSLRAAAAGLSFPDGSLLAVSPDSVFVLEPNADVARGFFAGNELLGTPSPRQAAASGALVTRLIGAGLLTAQARVSATTVRFSPARAAREVSYQWIVGAHPFGPFGRSLPRALSACVSAAVSRNALVAALDAATLEFRAAVDEAERFARALMYTPSYDNIAHGFDAARGSRSSVVLPRSPIWTERLVHFRYSEAVVASSLARQAVADVHEQIERFESELLELFALASEHRFAETVPRARALAQQARKVAAFVRETLARVRVELGCCTITHEPMHDNTPVPLALLGFVVLVALAVSTMRAREYDPDDVRALLFALNNPTDG